MQYTDILTELRVELVRQRRSAKSIADGIGHRDRGRRLRRWLRGEQEMAPSELEAVTWALGLTVDYELYRLPREDTK